jgi:copper chaperone CopZ
MKLISKILVAITVLLSFAPCDAQIKNATTESVKIYGNCGMCKAKIEKIGNLKNSANVDWNADTKMAVLTYDPKMTNKDEILKRIALAGYDSDKFLAPDAVYSNLPGCCQYNRESKVAVKAVATSGVQISEHKEMDKTKQSSVKENQTTSQLTPVFDNYFAVKDALVKTDGSTASVKAKALLSAINTVKMETLKSDEHVVWMKVVANLKNDAKDIADSKEAKYQRDHFDTLSKSIYALIKVSKQETPTYLQHCPMANGGKGADWLSKENTVKNPYYGSMMLTCGKTVETIK